MYVLTLSLTDIIRHPSLRLLTELPQVSIVVTTSHPGVSVQARPYIHEDVLVLQLLECFVRNDFADSRPGDDEKNALVGIRALRELKDALHKWIDVLTTLSRKRYPEVLDVVQHAMQRSKVIWSNEYDWTLPTLRSHHPAARHC